MSLDVWQDKHFYRVKIKSKLYFTDLLEAEKLPYCNITYAVPSYFTHNHILKSTDLGKEADHQES